MSQNRKLRRRSKRAQASRAGSSAAAPAASAVHREVAQGIALGTKLINAGQLPEAETLLDQLMRIEPGNPDVLFQRGLVLEMRQQADAAADLYAASLAVAPGHLQATVRLAALASGRGDYPWALELLTKTLRHSPNDPQLRHLTGQACEAVQMYREAATHYAALAELRPQHAAYELLGNALFAAGDVAEARRAFKKALQHGSRPEKVLAVLARLETSVGNSEAALAHLRSALRQAPEDGFAYLQLASDFSEQIDAREVLDAALQAQPVASTGGSLPANIIPMCFAYARLHELLGDYDSAFAYYSRGNVSLQNNSGYDPAAEAALFTAVRDAWRRADEAEIGKAGDSEKPVFVFGLPRSGTTLLEQILTSHPDVSGLGEHEAFGWISRYLASSTFAQPSTAAEFYLSSYPADAQSALRVVDKSMSTPEHVGTILKVFPNASFIHCQRHPIETGWSMYSMYFGDRRVPYSNSFEGIVARTKLNTQLMEFWGHELPGRVLNVRYDDLVSDMQRTATRALLHIGLDWHPACAEFHTKTNMVRTASITQVRQPIYTTAKQKWRRYEKHLAPLQDLLAAEIDAYESGGNAARNAP